MLRWTLYVVLFVLLTAGVTACGGNPETATPTAAAPAPVATTLPATQPAPATATAVPVEQPASPLSAPDSPLAAPVSPLAAPVSVQTSGCDLDFPAPAAGTGIVCGRVVSNTPVTRYFMAGDFYLAPVIYSKAALEDGSEIDVPFISLNVGSDKLADVKTEIGEFVFLDVPPGEYGVVIYTPLQSFLFHDGSGENTLMFEVTPGEIEKLDPIALD
jgi:hypothetical protein